jgi:cytochrome b561
MLDFMLNVYNIKYVIYNMVCKMAFQERIEWLTLLAMTIAYGIYFSLVAAYPAGPSLMETLWLFAKVSLVHVAVVSICSLFLAITNAKEAQARGDERDRAISRRGASIAYYVLLTGVIIVGVVMPFENPPAAKMVNATLLVLVIAESIRHVVMLISYRKGWNG